MSRAPVLSHQSKPRLRPRYTFTLIAALAALLTVAGPSHAAGSSEDARPSRQRLQQSVTTLSAPEFEGRLTGTDANRKAAHYLADELEELGYVGIDEESLLEWYTQPVILADEPPVLTIVHGTGTEDRFGAGEVDVLVRPESRIYGTVSGGVVELPEAAPSGEWVAEQRERVVLIDARRFSSLTSDSELMDALLDPIDSPRAIVLALPPMGRSIPRGVFLVDTEYANEGPMIVQVTASVATALRGAGPDARLEINSSYRVTRRKVPNVLARLASNRDARENTPAIVLSAHFDGVGDASGEVRYPSAVDNATGTAVVLELARLLAAAREPEPNSEPAYPWNRRGRSRSPRPSREDRVRLASVRRRKVDTKRRHLEIFDLPLSAIRQYILRQDEHGGTTTYTLLLDLGPDQQAMAH